MCTCPQGGPCRCLWTRSGPVFCHWPAPPSSLAARPSRAVPACSDPTPVPSLHCSAHAWTGDSMTTAGAATARQPRKPDGPGPCCLPCLPLQRLCLHLALAAPQAPAAGPCNQVCTAPRPPSLPALALAAKLGGTAEDPNGPCSHRGPQGVCRGPHSCQCCGPQQPVNPSDIAPPDLLPPHVLTLGALTDPESSA